MWGLLLDLIPPIQVSHNAFKFFKPIKIKVFLSIIYALKFPFTQVAKYIGKMDLSLLYFLKSLLCHSNFDLNLYF